MSRSRRNSRLSRRSCASSSRSAVVKPVRPLVRSACARLTHSASAEAVRSRSRATAPMVLPSSKTSRIAPALNSSVNRRRTRRAGLLLSMRDIVSTFRKMSTKPGQAHVSLVSVVPIRGQRPIGPTLTKAMSAHSGASTRARPLLSRLSILRLRPRLTWRRRAVLNVKPGVLAYGVLTRGVRGPRPWRDHGDGENGQRCTTLRSHAGQGLVQQLNGRKGRIATARALIWQ